MLLAISVFIDGDIVKCEVHIEEPGVIVLCGPPPPHVSPGPPRRNRR